MVFTLLGAAKGGRYRIEATQVSGQNANNVQGYPVICASTLGRFGYTKANGSNLVFDPTPLTSYELGSGSPCTGTYRGEILVPRPGSVPRVVQTFTLQVPAMRLTHVKVPQS